MIRPPRFSIMSSARIGALAIHHIHADEAFLAERLDRKITHNTLKMNELRHGWLKAPDGAPVDEVMLARPEDGMRILMTHGGKAVREAVTAHLLESGFEEVPAPTDPLAACITEAQAAAVLESGKTGIPPPPELMKTHRILLAGAPNAGKSSLLNCLAGYDRAFVHAGAGATRDVVDELIDLGGRAVLAGDLPGYRKEEKGVGRAAWDLAAKAIRDADAIFFVADASRPWAGETAAAADAVAAILKTSNHEIPVLVVLNKTDLPAVVREADWEECFPGAPAVRVSSLEGGNAREAVENTGIAYRKKWNIRC